MDGKISEKNIRKLTRAGDARSRKSRTERAVFSFLVKGYNAIINSTNRRTAKTAGGNAIIQRRYFRVFSIASGGVQSAEFLIKEFVAILPRFCFRGDDSWVSIIGQKTASAEAGLTSLFLFAKMGKWECLFSKTKKQIKNSRKFL